MSAFDVTLHRARRLLGHPRALLLHDGLLSLNPELVWLDLWALEHLGGCIEPAVAAGSRPAPTPAALREWTRTLVHLHAGPLLAGEQGGAWLTTARDVCRRRAERLGLRLGAACMAAGAPDQAQDLYARLLEANPALPAIARAQAALPGPYTS